MPAAGVGMAESESTVLNEPRTEAVKTELCRVVESPAFRTSKRCREFLEYVVEHTLHGPEGTLKERSIGVELFHLPADFDTGQHTIVRVTANEVRKRLAQHYLAGNGAHHPVRIDLPPGSYSAGFTWDEPVNPSVTPPPVQSAPSWFTNRWLALPIAGIAVVGALFLGKWSAGKPISAGSKSSATVAAASAGAAGAGKFRMIGGSRNPFIGRNRRAWGPDTFSYRGPGFAQHSGRILPTCDPGLLPHTRRGDFRYDIPLAAGSYELHLHFAETGLGDFISAESSGEGQRVFRVTANGRSILDSFDVVADANGSNTSDERVFRDISPAEDGFLHLSFSSQRGSAILSGIELLPVAAGKVRPVRIRAGWTAAWQDFAGEQWQADSYFMGGNALVRTTNPAQQSNSIAPDMAVYASERWGHFSYAVPVADGRYRVTLRFCEGHYGARNAGVGGFGSRVFDVYGNGVALLRNFDIMKEAGGEGRTADRTFSGIQPTAQGKILLTFVPVKGMACVNGIEVVEDSK